MLTNPINRLVSPLFNFPLVGILNFDKQHPDKLTVIFRETKFDVDITPPEPLLFGDHLEQMSEREGIVHFNVAAKDGKVFRIGMKAYTFSKITQLLIEQLPPVRKNPDVQQIGLDALGLNEDEYQELQKFYNGKKSFFETLTEPKVIKRENHNLPRTLVYVPNGHHKGMYALLKTHGKVKEIGIGVFNRATLALPLDLKLPITISQLKVFRSALNKPNQFEESQANRVLLNACELFCVGEEFNYRGSIRPRTNLKGITRELNIPLHHIHKYRNVEKKGFLLDYLEAGTFFELLEKNPQLSYLEGIVFALKFANGLAVLHDTYGIVHGDQKPNNIFLSKDWDPKLGDFGFALYKNKINKPCGSPLYLPPEVLQAVIKNEDICASPSTDVWGLGLILFSLIGGIDFIEEWKSSFNPENLETKKEIFQYMINNFDMVKMKFIDFYMLNIPETEPLLYIIDKCLQSDPNDRLTSLEVCNRLAIIYYDLLSKEEKDLNETLQSQ